MKVFGKYMFKMMDDNDFMAQRDVWASIHDGIHTEEGIAEFMTTVQHTREPLNNVQFRIYLFPDYSETEMMMVYKVHHSLADGIATILMYSNFTDKPNFNDFPKIFPRFSLKE